MLKWSLCFVCTSFSCRSSSIVSIAAKATWTAARVALTRNRLIAKKQVPTIADLWIVTDHHLMSKLSIKCLYIGAAAHTHSQVRRRCVTATLTVMLWLAVTETYLLIQHLDSLRAHFSSSMSPCGDWRLVILPCHIQELVLFVPIVGMWTVIVVIAITVR